MFKALFSTTATTLLLVAASLAPLQARSATSTQVQVSGVVTRSSTYRLPDLQALPSITQTVDFSSAGVVQTHTYTGTSLWGVLDSAGVLTNPSIKNDLLNKVVVATGADGYQTVFSLGELSPNFGNRPDLIAYAETIGGISAPLGGDGFARVTAPGDVKGGRYVSNLTGLDVRGSGSTRTGSGGGLSSQFSVSGAVRRATSFDLAALQGLPSVTEIVGGHTYVGVSFWDLLSSTVGIDLNAAVKNDVLGMYVVATGSDGYQTVFSLGELSPEFGNQPDLVAYSIDGVSPGVNGFARLVVPNDSRAGRWVSNLTSLEVFRAAVAPVPEPPAAALLVLGFGALAVVAPRRRRTPAARPAAA